MSNATLTEWFPDKTSFRYIDAAIVSPTAAKAMEEERTIRVGWTQHPQIGVGSGQKMIDVGSRYGEYTLSALALGCDFVWAFEKNTQLVKYLREMLRINNNSFVERCSVINRIVSPIATNLDHFFFDELSTVPDGVKWLKVDLGGQDELNVVMGARKLVEYYTPISLLVHHYDGQAGHQALTEQFIAANGYDAKSVGIKISENEVISTSLIY